jgi:hypothetical protein
MLMLGLMGCSTAAAREARRDDGTGALGDGVLQRTLVAGTLIEATIDGARAWRRNPLGEILTAIVNADVRTVGDWVVIPAGSSVALRVALWQRPTITFAVLSVTVHGQLYPMRESVEMTPVPARQPNAGVVAVASGTRIRFVLSKGFTAARRLGGIP